jgi:signal transduction histidine kinase
MKLNQRLVVLLGSLLAIFLAALVTLHVGQRRSLTVLRAEVARHLALSLDRLLTLEGSPLERFTTDYTQWDEMCRFVASPEPAWAEINIQQSLASWHFHAAWVFDADQREVYHAYQPPFANDELAHFPTDKQRTALCSTTQSHFFFDTARGMLEIRTSPIHPSDDARRGDPPLGWLFAARLWTASTLASLGELTDSQATLEAPADGCLPLAEATAITVRQTLPDWQGHPLHQLTLRHTSRLLAQMIEYDTHEVWFYLVSGCMFIGLTAWFLHHWVRHPLQLIGESLRLGQPELAATLVRRRDEFADIAALIRTAEERRLALHQEVEDRTFAVQELRRAIAERAKLGRDLHDGVIQSIYAAGLTLQGLGPLLHSEPAEAAHRLSICVEGLNNVIAKLRRHIAGLEDDPAPPPSLADGLQQLLQEMRPVRAIKYRSDIDPLLDAAIPPECATQLALIAREALSNALRHSNASHITLRLGTDNSEPVFTIEDDGGGFAVIPATRRGHGLDNMTRRAEEIGAVLLIESVPDRGTRIRVELPWATLSPESKDSSAP